MSKTFSRRHFIRWSGIGLGALSMPFPINGRNIAGRPSPPMENKAFRRIADTALDAAGKAGANFVDVRICNCRHQLLQAKESQSSTPVDQETSGIGIRVIVGGVMGFASTSDLSSDSVAAAATKAVKIAKLNMGNNAGIELSPISKVESGRWQSKIERDGFDISIWEKQNLLNALNGYASRSGAKYIHSALYLGYEQKYYASSEGSYIDQEFYRISPNFEVGITNPLFGQARTTLSTAVPMAMGYEYLTGGRKKVVFGPSGTDLQFYQDSYDIEQDVSSSIRYLQNRMENANNISPGQYTLVLGPTHLAPLLAATIGVALEGHRVLGLTGKSSFITSNLFLSKSARLGSSLINLKADRSHPLAINTAGFDDEGVSTDSWDLIREGVVVGLQTDRYQATLLGGTSSRGCSLATSWNALPQQRQAGLRLLPSPTALSPDDMISSVDNGIYIGGPGPITVDFSRGTFMAKGTRCFRIEKGRITQVLGEIVYQGRISKFWNNCTGLCDESNLQHWASLSGVQNSGTSLNPVSVTCPTGRFDQVQVVNVLI